MRSEILPQQFLLGTRPPWAPVVDDLNFTQRKVDWSSWYLTEEEDMGESIEQVQIIHMLLSILAELVRERQWTNAFFLSNQFFAWRQDEPLVRVSPDGYLLDHLPPLPPPLMWEMWRPGHHPPRFALEIVSSDWKKDYEQAPAKYAQLGTQELVIFDPDVALGRTKNNQRSPLLVYRRSEEGAMFRVYAGPGPAYSEPLEAWLTVCPEEKTVRLRLARDALGKELIPTLAERLEQEQKQVEQEKKRAEQQQTRAELAEQRLRKLEEELQHYKTKTSY